MEAAVKCLHKTGNQNRLAWSFAFKALVFCDLEKTDYWQATLKEADDLIKGSGNERAMCLLYLANCRSSLDSGQYKNALNISLEGLKLAGKIGERIIKPFLLGHAALGALHSGQSEQAIELIQKGKAESEKVGHPLGYNFIQMTLAEILIRLERVEESIGPAQAVLQFFRQLDLGLYLGKALELNAEIVANRIPIDERKIDEMMDQAAAVTERSDSPWRRIYHLLSKTRINIKCNKLDAARECLAEARPLYKELGLENVTHEWLAVEKMLEDRAAEDS
jgi:hypothetical protein